MNLSCNNKYLIAAVSAVTIRLLEHFLFIDEDFNLLKDIKHILLSFIVSIFALHCDTITGITLPSYSSRDIISGPPPFSPFYKVQ